MMLNYTLLYDHLLWVGAFPGLGMIPLKSRRMVISLPIADLPAAHPFKSRWGWINSPISSYLDAHTFDAG